MSEQQESDAIVEQKVEAQMQNNLENEKKIEFYSQAVAAWFSSALERDKSLLTLSVAGIGVLVSIMPSAITCASSLLLYIVAILAFMVCLIAILVIFKGNQKHLEKVLDGETKDDPVLSILDNTAIISFSLAMLLSTMIGISYAITTYSNQGNKMATESQKKSAPPTYVPKSLNGAGRLPPPPGNNQGQTPSAPPPASGTEK